MLTVVDDDDMMVQSLNRNVGQLEGMEVIGSNGEKVGDVEHALADSSGKVTALSIDAGSFFNMNSKKVIVQADKLKLQDDKLKINMTKDQIGALPEREG
jgi:sporulation protein YlmC with PRC-barrel domain